MIGIGTKWARPAAVAAVFGLSVGCGTPSNESAADISGTAATEGAKAGTAPPKTQADYQQQYQGSGGSQSPYSSQSGYPGSR